MHLSPDAGRDARNFGRNGGCVSGAAPTSAPRPIGVQNAACQPAQRKETLHNGIAKIGPVVPSPHSWSSVILNVLGKDLAHTSKPASSRSTVQNDNLAD